ncbi:MAG: hypothetical protein WEA76_07230 [Acidimicrobiia bacterium]
MTRIGILAAWVVAVGIATTLAWQVVGAADDQVSDDPLTPIIAVSTSDPTTAPPSTDTTAAETGTTSPTGTDSTTPSSSPPPTSTTTTTPASTSPTTTGIPATTTAVSDGGTVTVTGTDPHVELVAVVAAPGWRYEIIADDDDGDEIEVRFQNTSGAEIRIRCEWEDGKLVADIDAIADTDDIDD